MSILEAQVFGLPVVAPNIHGLDQVVKNGETGCLYNSDAEAVEVIVDLLNNEKKYKTIKSNIKKFSKEYNDRIKYKDAINKAYFGVK